MMKKKCFLLICIAAAALCLCSCAKKQDGGQTRYRYVREELPLPVSGTYLAIYDITACGERVFVSCGTMDDNDDDMVLHDFLMDISGKLLTEYPTLSSTDDSFIGLEDWCSQKTQSLQVLSGLPEISRFSAQCNTERYTS